METRSANYSQKLSTANLPCLTLFQKVSFQNLGSLISHGLPLTSDRDSSLRQIRKKILIDLIRILVSIYIHLFLIAALKRSKKYLFFSECRDLIARMLVTDPQQRATIDMVSPKHLYCIFARALIVEQIREHPWVMVNGQPIPKAEVPQMGALTLEDINVDILDEIVRAGFDREQCIQSLVNNTYDDASATYFLLLYRRKRTSQSQQQRQAEIDGVQISAGSSIELLKQTQSGTTLSSIHETHEAPPRELTAEEIKRERRHSTKRNPKYPIDDKRARRHSAERPKRNITRVSPSNGHRRNNTVGSAVDIFEGPKSDRAMPTSPTITSPSRSPRSPVLSPKIASPSSSGPGSPANLIVLPSKRRTAEGEEALSTSASESGSPAIITRTKRATSESYNPKEPRSTEREKSPGAAQAVPPVSPSKDKDRKLSTPRKGGHRRYRSSDGKDQIATALSTSESEKTLKEKERSVKKLKRLSDRIQSGSMSPSPVSSPSINVRKMVKQTSSENVQGHNTITISHKHKSPREGQEKKDKNRHSREIPLDALVSINNNNPNNNNLTASGSIDKNGLSHSQSSPMKLTAEEAEDDWVIMNSQNSDDFKGEHKE